MKKGWAGCVIGAFKGDSLNKSFGLFFSERGLHLKVRICSYGKQIIF